MAEPDKVPAERRLAARELLERFPVLPTDRAFTCFVRVKHPRYFSGHWR